MQDSLGANGAGLISFLNATRYEAWRRNHMTGAIALGILSAMFFSSTFVLNRAMSLEGGHWVWTASLRYAYMLLFLSAWFVVTGRAGLLTEASKLFRSHIFFWTAAGSVGFGVFYALLCFSASYAEGWAVATTWQTTILATPVVLLLFGRKAPLKGLLFTTLIFIGITAVNLERAVLISARDVLFGGIPVLVAAFAYPTGNQMLWEACRGGNGLIPHITHPLADDGAGRVLLLTMGSLPFWAFLILAVRPPPPSTGQLVNTAIVALSSGVIATSIFLYARRHAATAFEINTIDSTQSAEVIFTLIGETLLLDGSPPGAIGALGIALTILGIMLFLRAQAKPTRKPDAVRPSD